MTTDPRVTTLGAQLRDFAVAALLAIVIATGAFVVVRNKQLAARQIELATTSAIALARDNRAPIPPVRGVLVGPATPSPRHPYLNRRMIMGADGSWRPLVASSDPARADDKLYYDAANRLERVPSRAVDGHAVAVGEMLNDGSGRAIAIMSSCDVAPQAPAPTKPRRAERSPSAVTCPVAIALTPPAAPAPFPFLVIIGVFGLGAALAAAGAMGGRRAAPLGLFASIATLAVPTMLWNAWIATAAILALAAGLAYAQQHGTTDRIARALSEHRTAYSFLTPAALAMFVLVATPFVIGILIGFYDHHHGKWTFVGIDNFVEILSGGGRPLEDPLNFWFILGVTVLWTLANVALHVSVGVVLALALSRHWLFGKGVFRVLLILPWAIPNYITALIWKGMFNGEYGAINSLLTELGVGSVSWFSSWATSFAANVTTNTWLGFPFMMVVAIGALETIPKELYEAAEVDGATGWQRFRHITLPHLRPALGPAVALGAIWTFNMFNIIYLVSAGKPNNSTNILVTDAYRWGFERGERYGMAAAYGTVIFLILLLWTVFGTRIVRRKEDA